MAIGFYLLSLNRHAINNQLNRHLARAPNARSLHMPVWLIVVGGLANFFRGHGNFRFEASTHTRGHLHRDRFAGTEFVSSLSARGSFCSETEYMASAISEIRMTPLQSIHQPLVISRVADGGRLQSYIGTSASDTLIGNAGKIRFPRKLQTITAVEHMIPDIKFHKGQ